MVYWWRYREVDSRNWSDSDSDLVSSTVTLTITDGDIPTIDTVPSVTLSETNLSDGPAPNASAMQSSTQTIT